MNSQTYRYMLNYYNGYVEIIKQNYKLVSRM